MCDGFFCFCKAPEARATQLFGYPVSIALEQWPPRDKQRRYVAKKVLVAQVEAHVRFRAHNELGLESPTKMILLTLVLPRGVTELYPPREMQNTRDRLIMQLAKAEYEPS